MSQVGQRERRTQQQVLHFFQYELEYRYLGNWKDRDGNRNVEEALLRDWLAAQGHDGRVVNRALRELDQTAAMYRYALSQPWVSMSTGPVLVEGADA